MVERRAWAVNGSRGLKPVQLLSLLWKVIAGAECPEVGQGVELPHQHLVEKELPRAEAL